LECEEKGATAIYPFRRGLTIAKSQCWLVCENAVRYRLSLVLCYLSWYRK